MSVNNLSGYCIKKRWCDKSESIENFKNAFAIINGKLPSSVKPKFTNLPVIHKKETSEQIYMT